MLKKELVQATAKEAGVPQKVVNEVLVALTDTIIDSLASGSDISLPGLGTFKTKYREGRQGVNPQTGEGIFIKPRYSVAFKAGKRLRDAVNSEAGN